MINQIAWITIVFLGLVLLFCLDRIIYLVEEWFKDLMNRYEERKAQRRFLKEYRENQVNHNRDDLWNHVIR